MRKYGYRLCSLILAIIMALSLTACSRDAGSEIQPTETEAADPMVRLYYRTEIITEDSCTRFDYEDNWWEKDSFTVVKYQLTEEGEKDILTESVYIGGVVVTTNRYYPEPGEYGMSYYQWETVYDIYENGRIIYSRSDMEKDNRFGHICDIESWKYDEYGRVLESRYEGCYQEGAGMLDEDGNPVGPTSYTYAYSEIESGSIGTCWNTDDNCTQLYYDSDYRHVRTEYFDSNKLTSFAEYQFNSAGCVTKYTYQWADGGYTEWTKYLYETVEVPLSVALKYPMFKWEYID